MCYISVMASKEKDTVIDLVNDWLSEVGADAQAVGVEGNAFYTYAKGVKVYMPEVLSELYRQI